MFVDQNLIVWNCQGAASNPFRNVVKGFVDMYKPKMFVLLEPRVSNVKAELVIRSLRF